MVDVDAIRAGYTFSTPALELDALVNNDKSDPAMPIRIPLSLLNRHGLVAGATGAGKTKTLQVIAEQLADQVSPSSWPISRGMSAGCRRPASPATRSCPEWRRGDNPGIRSVTDFGPLQLSKVLGLIDIPSSSLNPV